MNIVVAAVLTSLTTPWGQSVNSKPAPPEGVFSPLSLAAQEAPVIKRLTPILTVEEIEPSLSFWMQGLGFERAGFIG